MGVQQQHNPPQTIVLYRSPPLLREYPPAGMGCRWGTSQNLKKKPVSNIEYRMMKTSGQATSATNSGKNRMVYETTALILLYKQKSYI